MPLPRGRKHDAFVRQIVRHDVVAFLGDRVRSDDAPECVRRDVVFPDVPGRQRIGVGIFDDAHRENHFAAVEVDVDVANIAEALRLLLGEVHLERGRRCLVAHIEIRAHLEAERLANVEIHGLGIFGIRHRTFHIEHRKIERDRIHVLAAADRHVSAAGTAAASGEDERGEERRCADECVGGASRDHSWGYRFVRHSVTPASVPAASLSIFEGSLGRCAVADVDRFLALIVSRQRSS